MSLLFFRLSHRKHWKNPGRSDIWWSNLLSGRMVGEEWLKNLRLDYPSFFKLTDLIRHKITPDVKAFRSDTIAA